jgi:hypothetical protein
VSTVLALQTYKPLKWFKTTNKVENMYFQFFFWNDRLLLRLEENIRTSKKYTTLLRNVYYNLFIAKKKNDLGDSIKKNDSKLNLRF